MVCLVLFFAAAVFVWVEGCVFSGGVGSLRRGILLLEGEARVIPVPAAAAAAGEKVGEGLHDALDDIERIHGVECCCEKAHLFALAFVLGGAVGVEHQGREDELFHGDKEGGDAVLQVVCGDFIVAGEDTLALEDGEDECLDEVRKDDEFEGEELQEGTMLAEFWDGLQTHVEL